VGIESSNYAELWESIIIASLNLPELIPTRIDNNHLQVYETEDSEDDSDEIVEVDDFFYLVHGENYISLDDENLYFYESTTKSMKPLGEKLLLRYEAGFSIPKIGGMLPSVLKNFKTILKNIKKRKVSGIKTIQKIGRKIYKKKIFKRVGNKWVFVKEITIFGIMFELLKGGGEIGRTAAQTAVWLISIKMFANFICEEAVQTASMNCYIARMIDADTLQNAIDSHTETLKLSKDVIYFADSVPVLHEIQTSFRGFLTASEKSHDVWVATEKVMRQKENMTKAKNTAIVYIYVSVSSKITVNEISLNKYAPAIIKINADEEVKIKLSAQGYYDYETVIFAKEYEIFNVGTADKPIQMLKKEDGLKFFSIPDQKMIGTEITGKCIEVTDGDTITIRVPAESEEGGERATYKIRLYGIDSPERAHSGTTADAGGFSAKNVLSWLVEKEILTVQVKEIDKYDRLVGEIFFGGECVNLLLLRSGTTRVYRAYIEEKDKKQYISEEDEAKRYLRGIWKYPIRIEACREMYEAKGLIPPETKAEKKARKEQEKAEKKQNAEQQKI